MHHLIFNGDADGLCAAQQLRLHDSAAANVVTGPKREIDLVSRVRAAPGDRVTVLDLSFAVNSDAVMALLDLGIRVRFFDHHYPGSLPSHPLLELHIDTRAATCTSLIVNKYLGMKEPVWAAVGAFGDNLDSAARAALETRSVDHPHIETLRELGICLNYNSYGESERDLLIAPAELHRRLIDFEDPLEFARHDPAFAKMRDRLSEDMILAERTQPFVETTRAAAYVLPLEAWSRRVNGPWAHSLANKYPERAHAVLTPKPTGGYVVSVRAPKTRPSGAATFCSGFPSGGGRESAAGINYLPEDQLHAFCQKFLESFDFCAAKHHNDSSQ